MQYHKFAAVEYALEFLATLNTETLTPQNAACNLQRHRSKIATDLKRAGITFARRGQAGGHRLSRPLKDISVHDLYEALFIPLTDLGPLNSIYDELRHRSVAELITQEATP